MYSSVTPAKTFFGPSATNTACFTSCGRRNHLQFSQCKLHHVKLSKHTVSCSIGYNYSNRSQEIIEKQCSVCLALALCRVCTTPRPSTVCTCVVTPACLPPYGPPAGSESSRSIHIHISCLASCLACVRVTACHEAGLQPAVLYKRHWNTSRCLQVRKHSILCRCTCSE